MLGLFIIIIFLISAISDIGLNILSRLLVSPDAIKALKPYFQSHSVLVSAGYAGITVVTAFVVTILISELVFGFSYPKNIKELVLFILLAAPIGYMADLIIYYFQIFGPLMDDYYKEAGAGFWGSAAYIFAIVGTYFTNQYLSN